VSDCNIILLDFNGVASMASAGAVHFQEPAILVNIPKPGSCMMCGTPVSVEEPKNPLTVVSDRIQLQCPGHGFRAD
jgi:hypothetical protein